ncbi:MAG TPA: recombinase family protein [Streptosporangiaceae bacterium]|nr:recombinase family protein [Streptosporangiaceae bacterium]
MAELIRRIPEDGCALEGEAQMPAAWDEFTVAELGDALAETRQAATGMLELAHELEVKLPGTRAAFRTGVLRLAKVEIIARAVANLDPDEARAAETLVLERAGRLTPGGLRSAVVTRPEPSASTDGTDGTDAGQDSPDRQAPDDPRDAGRGDAGPGDGGSGPDPDGTRTPPTPGVIPAGFTGCINFTVVTWCSYARMLGIMNTMSAGKPQVSAQAVRERAVSRVTAAQQSQRSRESWAGEGAAIYCRVSHIKDKDQTSVERQERISRGVVDDLGLSLGPGRVLLDPNRSAWQRNRKRPGWDQLLELARDGAIRHIVVYHPDRLMRQPWDLEELLKIAEEHGIILHGKSGNRDLSNPDDRHYLRGEVAHACRSSDDTSRRLKDAMVDRARDGKPQTGSRRYGYAKNGMEIIEHEAEIVRWIFGSFLGGMTPFAIAEDLNERGIPTAQGKRWRIQTVLKLLDSRHVAGIRVFRGEEIGPGIWPAIIDPMMFREAQERRSFRSVVTREEYTHRKFYLLRGLLWCTKCGMRMSGRPDDGNRPVYVCTNFRPADGGKKCYRRAGAASLEGFVKDAAINLLERLDVTGDAVAAVLSEDDHAAIDADRVELAELKAMWDAREIATSEYREMRKKVEERIRKIEAKTIIRPAVEVLEGMTGPDARATWEAHEKAGNLERLNAVLRFLFAAIRIAESNAAAGSFDYGRIEIEQNQP